MWSGIFIMWFDHFFIYVMRFPLFVFSTSLPIPSSSTQALLATTNWLNRFLDVPSSFSSLPGLEDNKMAGTDNDILSTLLDKMYLGHLIENFQREKVTVDKICKLSSEEMELLGVNDRNAMMNLRLACLNCGSNPPPRKPGTQACGAPEYLISKSVLEGYLEDGFNIKDIASLLSVSESTVYRRMGRYGLSQLQFTEITEDELVLFSWIFCGSDANTEILRVSSSSDSELRRPSLVLHIIT